MCSYHTWFHDDKSGYVIECAECHNIQLGFGNLMITFEKEDFEMFRRYIQKSAALRNPSRNKHTKSIMLKTPCKGIDILLSEAELYDLNEMIDCADTEMQSSAMLKLFN